MKKSFVEAYCWMYGETKKNAVKVYNQADNEYITAIIQAFKSNAKKSFYQD